jgi:hypothetical protein
MDKWVRALSSVRIDDNVNDPKYVFTYTNSGGETLIVYRDRCCVNSRTVSAVVYYHQLDDIRIGRLFKANKEDMFIEFATENYSTKATVDTFTDGAQDLTTIQAQIRRLFVAATSENRRLSRK